MGTDAKTTQTLMGHEDRRTTLAMDAAPSDGTLRKAHEKVAARFLSSKGGTSIPPKREFVYPEHHLP